VGARWLIDGRHIEFDSMAKARTRPHCGVRNFCTPAAPVTASTTRKGFQRVGSTTVSGGFKGV
jgi:hypothetical protein